MFRANSTIIKAIFWDIDGTLTDDQIHKVKHKLLAKDAYKISESEGMQLNGISDRNTYFYLYNKSPAFQNFYPNVGDYLVACRRFFESHALNSHSQYRIKARQGAIDLVRMLSSLGILQACVTSAPDWQAKLNIAALGISKDMLFIQMLSEGIKPKPHPDLYQLAFEKMSKLFLDLKKSEVLVIEDSISGVLAAKAAGLQVIHCRMNELAPISDKTTYHAFNFSQVKDIIAKQFNLLMDLQISTPSFLSTNPYGMKKYGCTFKERKIMSIKNIIFDMGDVLVENTPSLTPDAFCALGAKRNVIDAVFNDKDLFIQYHKGEISSEKFRAILKQKLYLSDITNDQFDQAWLASITEPKLPSANFAERMAFIEQLRLKGYNIFLLSNNNEIHYINTIKWYGDLLNKAIPIQNQYYSHHIGYLKPEREIFQYVLTKNNLHPNETIFFDDVAEYVCAAKSVGMHAMQFTRVEPMSKIIEIIKNINQCEAKENKMVTSLLQFNHFSKATEKSDLKSTLNSEPVTTSLNYRAKL
ncbi:MAG: HAD-IA family hydrolase [Gammaproteobacteria bacterium]|nr:HAD-IA family hydrolase [Gammaproteobacteria bacterium]